MHEEQLITTTTATSKFSNSTIVNAPTSLHQSTNDDGTIMVSIVHQPHQHADFTTLSAAPCSTITNQIAPSQTKLIDLQTLKEDVTSVIINGSISNTNDPNVLILPSAETCDSDKNAMSLGQLTDSHSEQADIDLHDVNSMNDETSSGEGESLPIHFFFPQDYARRARKMLLLMLLMMPSTEERGWKGRR